MQEETELAQPDPKPNTLPAVWDEVVKIMQERDKTGLKRYGVRLQPFNGRDFLVDARDEVLDLAVYIQGRIEEEKFERQQLIELQRLVKRLQDLESGEKELQLLQDPPAVLLCKAYELITNTLERKGPTT